MHLLGTKKKTYVIIILFFVIWMIFFDTNSVLMHFELNQKIKKLENQKKYYKEEIKKDKASMNEIESDSGIEKYAREKLFMKKENEEISTPVSFFIVVYCSSIDRRGHLFRFPIQPHKNEVVMQN